MTRHIFLNDPALSVSRGEPLSAEPGMGALTLCGFLEEVVASYDEREALVQNRMDGSIERWTYADLLARSRAVARSLIALGLGKGERVAILMTNRAEFLSSVFGTLLAGGVAAPIGTFSTQDELAYLLSLSGCSHLLFEPAVLKKDFLSMLGRIDLAIEGQTPERFQSERLPFLQSIAMLGQPSQGAVRGWDDFLDLGRAVSDTRLAARTASVAPADPAVLFFSSGSTAKPKGILSSHQGVAIQLWRMGRQQGLDDGVRSWTANGFFWSGNFAMIVGGTLAMGGTLILQPTFDPAEALELMQMHRVSFPFAWPHQWEQLGQAANWNDVDLSSLKYVDQGCRLASHPTVRTHWLEPRHCYGNTETFTLSAAYPAMTSREAAEDSHGVPLPGNVIKIVDPLSGQTLPLGEAGEIALKGPTLMLGYLGTPLWQTVDENGFFRTGDGGHLDAEGRLHWHGRLNDIIKTGGANVSPLEIDEALRALPEIRISQTVGVPHDSLGEVVVACVVLHEGKLLDEASVRASLRTGLASYKVPRHVLCFEESEIGMTGTAKVKSADLRRLATMRLEGNRS